MKNMSSRLDHDKLHFFWCTIFFTAISFSSTLLSGQETDKPSSGSSIPKSEIQNSKLQKAEVIQKTKKSQIASNLFSSSTSISEPATLASNLSGPNLLTVDQDNVYWTDSGGVKKIGKNGGSVTTIASGSSFSGIAVDDTSIYWGVNPGGGSGNIYKIPKTGGTKTNLASANQPHDIDIDSTYVYWAEYNSGTYGSNAIRKVPIDGGTVTALTTSGTFHGIMTMDSNYVYFRYIYNEIKKIGKVSKDGGSVVDLASKLASDPSGMAVENNNVYWVETTAGTVKKVPIDGGVVTTLAEGLDNPQRIAVDTNSVYWTEYAEGTAGAGAIKKYQFSSGEVITLASGLNGPYDITIDDNYIYWTEKGTSGSDGSIKKLAINPSQITTPTPSPTPSPSPSPTPSPEATPTPSPTTSPHAILHIDGLSPIFGSPGTTVTITGSNFGVIQGSSLVNFGSNTASINSWNDTEILIAVPSLSPETYDVNVTTSNGTSNSLSFLVTEEQTGGDFSLKVKPSQQTVTQGESIIYFIIVNSSNGFNQEVTLSTKELPSGVSATFSRNPVLPGESSELTVTTTSDASIGMHTFKIKGSSNGLTHSAKANIQVKRAKGAILSFQRSYSTEKPLLLTFQYKNPTEEKVEAKVTLWNMTGTWVKASLNFQAGIIQCLLKMKMYLT